MSSGLPRLRPKKCDRVDLAHALGAVGDVDRLVQVVQEHADDLAEAQRHDGQVVAAQLQRGRAQQDAEDARPAAAPAGITIHSGMCRPSGNIAAIHGEGLGQVRRGQQAVHVGTDGEEGDVAQVQQAGIADHDVQAQRQQHVQQRHVGNAHPGIAEALQHQRQDQQADARPAG